MTESRSPKQNIPRARNSSRNVVFAHYMVGNTYPNTIEDWYDDIFLAASQGLNGFVLNVGCEEWQKERSADCFKAIQRLPQALDFSLFFSFDMSSIPGHCAEDIQFFQNYISSFCNYRWYYRHPETRGAVISTFCGENCTFGQGSMEKGWAYLKAKLTRISQIHFVPSFFIDPARYKHIHALDGVFNWNGGWPLHLKLGSPHSELRNAKLDSDLTHIPHLNNEQTFMAAVSPWFFTHYGPDTWNKNWIYCCDDWLFVRRWEQLIAMRDRVDMVQIISWNDYGESHYIGPIKGAQPNSQAWVDGYPHTAWLYLNSYFATAFQTGQYPAITKDQIFMWARPHPKAAESADHVPRPHNWQITEDVAWVIILATKPATVVTSTSNEDKRAHKVFAGLNKVSFPLRPGGGMKAVMVRDELVVAECTPIGYRFEERPGVYNFNVHVSSSDQD
ncbi:glycoside hydrolase [Crepidotus variabilis]|uniref:Glycoside hydrolase n=1 Tax=Crepidotus variabilis TaxID=179855 RepID=A0A9P6JKL1_9AGAR|nr:glycoside hydrolase [Crepidotus variabilis]